MKLSLIATALAASLAVGPALAQGAPLPQSLSTADNDSIAVWGIPGNGSGNVRVCLQTIPGMWKKDIAFEGGAVLRSEGGTQDCIVTPPGFARFEFIKAKAFGVMTGVGYGSLDLTGWGGGTVNIMWTAD